MRVLCWNLFHGRAVPAADRPLLHEFAAALAGWPWDVALLQEVPPWWPPLLARACDADHRTVLTSRNALLPVRRALASRRPDLLKSGGGGADAILVRGPLRIDAHARRRLRTWPERRVVHAVRLGVGPVAGEVVAPAAGPGSDAGHVVGPAAGSGGAAQGAVAGRVDDEDRLAAFDGAWVGNLHAEPPPDGTTTGSADATEALAAMARWAAGRTTATCPPVVLGGDFNLRPGPMDAALPPGWSLIASRDVDHVVVLGARAGGPPSLPDRTIPGRTGDAVLSDHPPLRVDVVAGSQSIPR